MNLDNKIDSDRSNENVSDYYMSPDATKPHPVRDFMEEVYSTLRNVRQYFSEALRHK